MRHRLAAGERDAAYAPGRGMTEGVVEGVAEGVVAEGVVEGVTDRLIAAGRRS